MDLKLWRLSVTGVNKCRERLKADQTFTSACHIGRIESGAALICARIILHKPAINRVTWQAGAAVRALWARRGASYTDQMTKDKLNIKQRARKARIRNKARHKTQRDARRNAQEGEEKGRRKENERKADHHTHPSYCSAKSQHHSPKCKRKPICRSPIP